MNKARTMLHIARERAKVNPEILAKKVGYARAVKGARHILSIERGEVVDLTLMRRMGQALGVDAAELEAAIQQDEKERRVAYEAWLDTPVPPQIVVKWIPAIYGSIPIPTGMTDPAELEAYACAQAKRMGKMMWLAINRRVMIFIDETGTVTGRSDGKDGRHVALPMTTLGGKPLFRIPLADPAGSSIGGLYPDEPPR